LTAFMPSVSAIEVHPGGSIQDAINTAVSGQTIIVHNGDYSENILVNKSNIVIRSANGSSVTFIKSNATDKHVVTIIDQTNVTLEGFTIRDANGTSPEVAGIYMNNTNKCTISNNIVTNISAANHSDAIGIWLVKSDNNSFSSNTIFNLNALETYGYAYGIHLEDSDDNVFYSSTFISNITATTDACGILLGSSSNNKFNSSTTISRVTATAGSAGGIVLEDGCEYNSFSSTSVSNTSAGVEAAGIALAYSNNNSFSDTSIINVSANGLAAGIGLESSDGNTFDALTDVSYIHSYGGLPVGVGSTSNFLIDSTTTALTGYDEQLGGDLIVENVGLVAGNMACGIVLLDSDFNSFSDRTKVSYVMAENGEALGILLVYSFENTFSDRTEVLHIDACGGIKAPLESANLFVTETVTPENFEQYLDGNIACGIKLALSGNNTFNDRTDITYINATELACGIVLFILANDNEFYQCTISDLVSGSDDTTFGVFMLLSGDNLMSQAKIFQGGGPPLDFGMFLFWCSYNSIEDSDISDCYGYVGSYPSAGIVITAEGASAESPCYNTILRNRIHNNFIGIFLKDEWENEIAGNTIEDNGEGIGVFGSYNNIIEGNMIRNNTGGRRTGVYVDENSDENQIHGNCFFYNEPYQAKDDYYLGFSNHWEGNYWEPEPGEEPGDPFLIPGNAEARDTTPLGYCPMCAVQVPVVTPLGLAALMGLLAVIATSTLVRRRKRR
jgi:parallel beta-helix repeat protein